MSITNDINKSFTQYNKSLIKSFKWVDKNRNKINKNISNIQAIELYSLGLDVTQLKIKKNNYKK